MMVVPKLAMTRDLDKVKKDVGKKLFLSFIFPTLIIAFFVAGGVSYLLKRMSEHITDPIVELHQRINTMIHGYKQERIKGSRKIVEELSLGYRPRNKEVNKLYLAFSNLMKTIGVARNSLSEGNDNKALLGYHEVAERFENMGNYEKLGSCYNNLGCIYMKKEQFDISI
jgi:hypothetical protein